MSLVVLGAAGLLGSEIVKQLLCLDKSKKIYCIDIIDSPERLKHLIDYIEYIKLDITDYNELLKVFKNIKPKKVFHLSALLGADCEENYNLAFNVNVVGTFNIFNAAVMAGVSQILFASSVSTYSLDLKEDIIRDDSTQRPFSFYGICKLFGEGTGMFFKRKKSIDFRGIRYPYIIGKNINLRKGGILDYPASLIENAIKEIPSKVNVPEDIKIPIIYIKDAAKAMIQLGEASEDKIKKRLYLVNGVKPTPSAKELVQAIEKKFLSAQIEFSPDENISNILKYLSKEIDDSNACREWGWMPEFNSYIEIIEEFLK